MIRLTLRIPAAIHARYKAEAKRQCLSMAALIVRVLAGLQAAPKEEE